MPKTRLKPKSESEPGSALWIPPGDLEMKDQRELARLKELLHAHDYERNRRPAVQAEIARLRSMLKSKTNA